jgi:hypothetical protein
MLTARDRFTNNEYLHTRRFEDEERARLRMTLPERRDEEDELQHDRYDYERTLAQGQRRQRGTAHDARQRQQEQDRRPDYSGPAEGRRQDYSGGGADLN